MLQIEKNRNELMILIILCYFDPISSNNYNILSLLSLKKIAVNCLFTSHYDGCKNSIIYQFTRFDGSKLCNIFLQDVISLAKFHWRSFEGSI